VTSIHEPAHAHAHPHGVEHDHHRNLPPSGEGSVVLDIGDTVGALVVHAPAALAGRELELARRGETVQFVHTEVRERRLPEGVFYAAVFMAVPDGAYTLLDAPASTEGDVDIAAGTVTEVHWER
jgi:hypothetical protein